MVNKLISQLSVLAVLIAFLTGCSKQSEYTNVIPADTSVLASVNLNSIIKKAGLDSKDNEAAKQKLLDALKSGMNAATFEQLDKVIKDPSQSGIDLESPIYIFTSSTFSYPTMVAKVSNENDLKASLELMAKEQISQPISEADGYYFTTIDNNLLAFNSTTVMVVMTKKKQIEEAQKAISSLMKQTAENSINKSGAFKKMTKKEDDICFFASMAAIPDIYRQQVNIGLPANIDIKDITMIGGLNSEKGKITFNAENYTENDSIKDLMKKQLNTFGKSDGKFKKYFPASTLVFINTSVKGEELYSLLSENKEFNKAFPRSKVTELKELITSLNGDIALGSLNVTMNNTPTFVAYAEVKDGKALQSIYKNKQDLRLKRNQDILELSKDEYVFKTKGMNIFFGVKDKQMYFTNDELIYKNIDKVADKSVEDAPYASDMKGKKTFMVINIEEALNLPIVKMLAGFGGEETKTYFEMASKLSYLSASSKGETSEMELCFKDKETNALKQIVDFAKQFAGM